MTGSVGQPTMGWFPWQASYSQTASNWTRYNDASNLGMGFFYSAAQNDEVTVNWWLDSVTYKVCKIGGTASDRGIITVKFNGVTVGTMDTYSVGSPLNVYQEITGIAVATPALTAVQCIAATRNGSSSGYRVDLASLAIIATSGTYSTPAGTDTPGYTWQFFPWMGAKSNVTWSTSGVNNSGYLGGGYSITNTGAQNSARLWDVWTEARTYKVAAVYGANTDRGIMTFKNDSITLGTIDAYAASNTPNTYTEITGIAIGAASVKTFQVVTATKNVLALSYECVLQSVALISTGA